MTRPLTIGESFDNGYPADGIGIDSYFYFASADKDYFSRCRANSDLPARIQENQAAFLTFFSGLCFLSPTPCSFVFWNLSLM